MSGRLWLADLVATLLTPLLTARALHLSVRALTYRLDRVRALTGHDPARPTERFALQVAALGANLLDCWNGRMPR